MQLRNHAHIFSPDGREDHLSEMLVTGRLQVVQILLERRFIELRQKIGVGGAVVSSDVIDNLTLGHMLFSVGSGSEIT